MKTKFSIELDEAYYNQLKTLAASEFRSLKATAEMIVVKHLDNLLSENDTNSKYNING